MPKITDNVYVETGYPGANVGYVTTECGIVMIESPMRASDAVLWREQILNKGKIICLIHTEGHHDHVTGDYFFDAPVICHEKSRQTIMTADITHLKESISKSDPEGAVLMNDYHINIPVVTYSHSLTLYIGKHTFKLMNTPGHTPGQTSILIPEERVVFTGDNVCYHSPAFLHEAVPEAWIESLQKIGNMEADFIIPGHGEICDRSYIKLWSEYIEAWFEKVRQAVNKGWSKEESIEKIVPPPGFPINADEAFVKMMVKMNVSHLYDIFSNQKP